MHPILHPTKTTPLVKLSDGLLLIRGNSFPILTEDGYLRLMQCIRLYKEKPQSITVVKIDVGIVNGFTKRCLMKIFRLLEKASKPGHSIVVQWLYEKDDEDMLDLGGIYKSLISLPVHFIAKD